MKLTVINHNGIEVVDSREVAEMTGKPHNDLMKSIRNYREALIAGDFSLNDFFIESNYKDSIGRTLPCYLLTKKGCDMVANKMTGEKGVLFTAAYVTAFEKMREQIKNPQPMSTAQMFAMQAQVNLEQEQRIKALEASSAETTQAVETVRDALDIMVAPSVTAENWQSQMNRNVRAFCMQTGFDFHKTFQELYAELEASAGVKLGVRVKYARKRLLKAGATQTEIASVSKLSLVAQDRKLREIFNSLFNRMVARYTIGNDLGEKEVG